MAWPSIVLWFDNLAGVNTQQIDDLEQRPEGVEFAVLNNAIPDPPGNLVTSPGFSKVRSTAILNGPPITGMFHGGDLADIFVIGNGTTGDIAFDTANPPVDNTSGTNFTTGANALLRADFHENLMIIVSNARDLPQTVNASSVRADLGGTPPYGIDYKVLAQRGIMFSPLHGGVTYRGLASFNSARNDHDAWTLPVTTNALNFSKYEGDATVLGGEYFQDHVIAFTKDAAYPIYPTDTADSPFGLQQAVFNERGGGPPNIHAVVAANDRLYWISRNFDVKMMLTDRTVKSIGLPVQPFLRGLNDSRRIYTVGGWEPQYRLVVWAVSDGSDTQNKDCLILHVDTGRFYFRTISRNAFANRSVSGELRLIGGGYSGFFYNEFDSSTTGDLDNSASAIDADLQGPRHHLGLPGMIKKGVIMAVIFDPIGSETVTVQGNYDDETAFTSLNTTVSMTGTDHKISYFRLSPFEYFQPRFRDAISGERFRVLKYGFSRPTSTWPRFT